jgi:hypothetical protein
MLIAGFIIRTVPGKSDSLRQHLASYREVAIRAVAEDAFACTWTGSATEFEEFAGDLTGRHPDVIAVLPTFSSVTSEESASPVKAD